MKMLLAGPFDSSPGGENHRGYYYRFPIRPAGDDRA